MKYFFFSSRRRHTTSLCDWSSDVCSSDLPFATTKFHHVSEARTFLHHKIPPCQRSAYLSPPQNSTMSEKRIPFSTTKFHHAREAHTFLHQIGRASSRKRALSSVVPGSLIKEHNSPQHNLRHIHTGPYILPSQ